LLTRKNGCGRERQPAACLNDGCDAPVSESVDVSVLLTEVAGSLPPTDGESAASAARALIAAVLDRSWSTLRLAEREQKTLSETDVERVRDAVRRMRAGMPLAYAVGSAAFRHLVLHVDERVLIPRPETEIVVDHALRLMQNTSGGLAVDVGTGSGAIALALAQEGAFERVIGTDISADALAVARLNGERVALSLGTPVEWRLGADLSPVQGLRTRLIVCNPPYIAFSEAAALPSSVRDWEPPTALFAADNGMARYAELLRGAPALLEPGGWIVLECDSRRAAEAAALAERLGAYHGVRVYDDLTGRPRVLVAQRRTAWPLDAT